MEPQYFFKSGLLIFTCRFFKAIRIFSGDVPFFIVVTIVLFFDLQRYLKKQSVPLHKWLTRFGHYQPFPPGYTIARSRFSASRITLHVFSSLEPAPAEAGVTCHVFLSSASRFTPHASRFLVTRHSSLVTSLVTRHLTGSQPVQ